MQLYVRVANFLSSLFASLKNQSNQINGGGLPNVPANDVALTSTLTSAAILAVTRNHKTGNGIFGEITIKPNPTVICYSMENLALAIPAGQYPIEIYDSPHAGHPVPLLQNVPGRSFVEIHCGNTPGDSKGCIIVGLDRIGNTLEKSQDAFNILFPKIEAAVRGSGISLQIVDSIS